jgi:hypothetical protein
MSEEFQVGDVVVCVCDRSPTCIGRSLSEQLRQGVLYRITATLLAADGLSVLVNGEAPHTCACHIGEAGWHPDRFRKLPRADEEFTRQIRACKPQRVPSDIHGRGEQ